VFFVFRKQRFIPMMDIPLDLSWTPGAEAADVDLEKANGISGEQPYSSTSQSTWESQNGIWSSPNSPTGEQFVIEEDSDEESGKLQGLG
jgi:hypothetical protein